MIILNAQMLALVERHCSTLRKEFEVIEFGFDAAMTGGDALSRLRAATHKIKGSSGTLGFPEVAALAENYERALQNAELAGVDIPVLRANHAALARVVAGVKPEQSTLHARFSGGAK
ncbi:Hpt domain-containing protein [Aestuariibius insulae]|uniref:Hpt domain-containing protein n=1 Tax=Aestuariibius insulae TaxID=2058287 RepID=UPI00398F21FB